MKKFFPLASILIAMIFCVCTGCSGTDRLENLQNQLEDLQNQLTELQDRIEDMESRLEDSEKQMEELQAQIEKLHNQIEPPDSSDGGEIWVSIQDLYNYKEESSLAILKISSIKEGIYQRGSKNFLVCECIVEEDFHGHSEAGSIVYIPITWSYLDPYDISKLKELFVPGETVFSYIAFQCDLELYSVETNELYYFTPRADYCNLPLFQLIPFIDNKLALNSLCAVLDQREVGYMSYTEYRDYTKYLDDGMELEEVKENLRSLAEIQKLGENGNEFY